MPEKLVWILIVAFLLLTCVWGIHRFFQTSNRSFYAISRQIRYSCTVENTSSRKVENASLKIYAPVEQTSFQACETIESSHPYELSTDCLGNQILHFPLSSIAPYASEIIRIQTSLRLSKDAVKTVDSKLQSGFLSPEPHVESGHPDITARAAALKRSNTLETAEAIYEWVAAHIEDCGYLPRERGALYALTYKKGDCTEYMDLFTALCRAAGIPCRRTGGFICDKNQVIKASGYHNWAEICLDGKWRVVDPQNRIFMENEGDYIAIQIIGSQCPNPMNRHRRFRVEGQGITAKMNS